MNIIPGIKKTRRSLRRKLFLYMSVLALLLAAALCAGLLIIGRISSPSDDTANALSLQMSVFQGDMSTMWRSISVMGTHLSDDMAEIIEADLIKYDMSFDDLYGNVDAVERIEGLMVDSLCSYIRQTDCSGAFIILDTSLNTKENSGSRSGLYIQKSNAEHIISDMLLYRGMANAGKSHGVMPHRKWSQEFDTKNIPEYKEYMSQAQPPAADLCRTTATINLPGTSEKAILLTVPVYSSSGRLYGLCGFAVNQTYFSSHHDQPSNLKSVACLLTSGGQDSAGRSNDTNDIVDTKESLHSSATSGYCHVASEQLTPKTTAEGLTLLSGSNMSYIAMVSDIYLTSNDDLPHRAIVMIPESDYRSDIVKSALQAVVLVLLLLFFSIVCCLYFTRCCMRPVLDDLGYLRQENIDSTQLTLEEFYTVSSTLQEKQRSHRAALDHLENERRTAQREAAILKSSVDRLAYMRKKEIDPDAYQVFREGINSLTATESEIFTAFADGLSIQDLAKQTGRAESTLRTHLRNIYSKLDVHSAKQLRLYAAVLRNESNENNQSSDNQSN